MATLIEAALPASWRDLEACVAQILRECGYDTEVQKTVPLARGNVDIDVWADDHSSPPNVLAVECKRWSSSVSKNVVHGFRTVVGDSGANTGLIVSSGGFQEGAVEAAAYSNIRLVNWLEFQVLFVERWYQSYMAPRLREEAGPLIEYTEPINSRVSRKAQALPPERRVQLDAARKQYFGLGLGSIPMYISPRGGQDPLVPPRLPVRDVVTDELQSTFPIRSSTLRPCARSCWR